MPQPPIRIEQPNPQDHLETEWLLADGLGGYAMATVLGINTRRYHGLLVAAMQPPLGRIVSLHSMIEQLVIPRSSGGPDEVVELSTQMFVGPDGQPMMHPDGWKRVESVVLESGRVITWTWRHGEVRIERSLMVSGNTVTLGYTIEGADDFELRLRPVTPLRDFHSLHREPGQEFSVEAEADRDMVTIRNQAAALRFSTSNAAWVDQPRWWRNFAYPQERERGLDWQEDIFSAGYFSANRSPMIQATIVGPHLSERRTARRVPQDVRPCASECFLVARDAAANSRSIIAGYPWFADWGRDAMISLPGLLLCSGRFDDAIRVLETFANHLRGGLIPNRFDDAGGEPFYNTVDASLWFVHAVWECWRAMARQIPAALLDAAGDIIGAYRAGVRHDEPREGYSFSIHLTNDHLIDAGDANTQLTWMDAKRDGYVFTPRHGLAVEVNALWHHALYCVSEMSGDPAEARELRALAVNVAEAFRTRFWWAEEGCLHDVLHRRGHEYIPDGKLRPNQIFAASLAHSPLTVEQRRSVFGAVTSRLLTPFGLRTLDRDDPDYQPRYEGDMLQRDRAYHNGTAWPWLMGAYCEALLRLDGFSVDARSRARALLQPLLDEASRTSGRTCLGHIAEVYDGDPPHRPDGCPAQVWSIAEVNRVLSLIES